MQLVDDFGTVPMGTHPAEPQIGELGKKRPWDRAKAVWVHKIGNNVGANNHSGDYDR